MSSTIKRQNHRIHPCNRVRKNELVQFLIERNGGKKILIVTANETDSLKNVFSGDTVTVMNDTELAKQSDYRCDLLISYDLPEKAIIYMTRLAKADDYALILLDAEDQKHLYGIELLNGRTIIQEVIEGFEPDFGIAVENQQKAEAKARRAEREELFANSEKPRRDTRPTRHEGDGFEAKKQQKGKPRFVGKDENGKPIFDGKTRERNHYIDGTPRTEEEKRSRTKFSSKPKFFGDKEKKSDDRKNEGERQSYGEKKPFDKDKKSYGDKKTFGDKKEFGNKKPYGDKPAFGEKKPYGDKKPFGDRKPYDKEGKKSFGDKKPLGDKKPYQDRKPTEAPAAPKRAPRRIDVKSLKPKDKE